ncbi:MAG: Urease accessory protein [Nitrosopumilus sp. H8]|nr:MAG: Urease accessory protein [Nitrosopumilus sp. H8]RNJ78330.1 MAG: Urease accessory protein [Nitrosopumilus sp. H13]
MLRITSISGNIHDGGVCDGDSEHLCISRGDLEKSRLRRETDGGTDIGLSLDPGTVLRDGDVLAGGKKPIIVRQTAEMVISVRLDDPEMRVVAGHVIGNHHRPVAVEKGVIYFPVQADSELEVFEKLFAGIGATLSIEEMVFTPHRRARAHEH